MVRKTKEEAENTKREIMKAALDVFSQKGYSRTTFEDIAARINLTKGAVYWHFKNKPDLLMELLREHFDKRFQNEPVVNTFNDLRSAMVAEAERIQNDIEERKFLFFAMFQMEWSEAMMNKLHETIQGVRDFPLQRIKKALTNIKNNGELADDIDVDEVALLVLHVWKGALSDGIVKGNNCNFAHIVGRSIDLVVSGIKK
ncbi:MAG: TetR family transcriptional regulator [Alphaproteobacteria bacterium]|nr:TetR family transcriptional regulator [Alphaproteobacteria bacterium]